MVARTGNEAAYLLGAARQGVARSSIRKVAAQAGMSPRGLSNLLSGRTARIYGPTIAKLRAWYLRQQDQDGDGPTPEVVAYLVEQVVAPLAPEDRDRASLELVDTLEQIFDRHGIVRPAWLGGIRGR
jgi:AcrR family transcriptional regulator